MPQDVTRHIKREVERELWARAAGRCAPYHIYPHLCRRGAPVVPPGGVSLAAVGGLLGGNVL